MKAVRTLPTTRSLRTIAVVSRNPHEQVLEIMLDAVDDDVVFVESIAHAYSQVKRVAPDLVIVCLSSDDLEGWRVLTMLRLDSETSRIPALVYVTSPSDARVSNAADAAQGAFRQVAPISTH
jgi:PleD family two-component response regulator